MIMVVILMYLMGMLSDRGHGQQNEQLVDVLMIGNLDRCEGKDAGNFTYVSLFQLNSLCTGVGRASSIKQLLYVSPNGQSFVNNLLFLDESLNPRGADIDAHVLFLVISGNLQGKFVYLRLLQLSFPYLKKCSSVLGLSYLPSKESTLLIADKLELDIFVNPSGAYEPFKKISSTICQGRINTF